MMNTDSLPTVKPLLVLFYIYCMVQSHCSYFQQKASPNPLYATCTAADSRSLQQVKQLNARLCISGWWMSEL